ncbi:MAG: PAS domain S-box protein [Gallionella sp.]
MFNLNPRKSIQARLSLTVGGGALLLVIALSFRVAGETTSTIKALQGQRVSELALQMLGDLDGEVSSRKHEMAFFASMPALRASKTTVVEKRHLLDRIKAEQRAYAWFGITDQAGNIIAGSDGLLEGLNVSQRNYFIHGKEAFFAGEGYDAHLLGKYVKKKRADNPLSPLLVDVTMPIYDTAGAFSGILMGHLNGAWSEKTRDRLLNNKARNQAEAIFVLSKTGKVLIGPKDYLRNVKQLPTGLLARLKSVPEKYQVSRWQEGLYLSGYAGGPGKEDYQGLGWQVLIREPVDRAFQGANRLRDSLLIDDLLAVLLLSTMGWYLTGYILQPLRKIAQAAERIRHGESGVCIPHFDSEDEAAVLAESMGHWVTEFQNNNRVLGEKIQERTRELAQKAQMIDAVSDAILRVDMDRNIKECNAGAVKMFGYPADELKTLSTKDLYPAHELDKTQQFIAAELAHKDTFEFTSQYVKKSGVTSVAHVLLRVLRDEQGEQEGFLVYIVDVTARVAMEEKLVLSQQIAHFGLWDWNIQSDEQTWTDEIYRIFGLPPQQLVASYVNYLDCLHPEDRDRVNQTVQAARVSGQPYEIEYRIVKPDGAVRTVLENGHVYQDKDGKPIRMVGVVHDISERRAIQKQIELFRQMIETSNDPIYLMDAADECRLVYVNEAAVRLRQVPRETLLTWRLADWDPNFKAEDIPRLIEFTRDNPGSLRETEYCIGDGTRLPVSVSSNLMELDHKTYLFGYFKDITRRKQIEQELAQAKAHAEAANEAKSHFLANMSHEIRTPMNAIIGFSQLCLQTELDTIQRDYLEKVSQSANALLSVLNDILDFSKLESGKLEMENVPFLLDDVLVSVSAMVGDNAEEKGLELLFDAGLEIPQSLVGDTLRLGQVLNNLVKNAVKFTDQGEIIVRVGLVSQSAQDVTLRFSVSDTGIGMTADEVDNLYQSFSQVDASTTRKYGGTGLGLAINKQLVALMGGHIWVESASGRGSCFIFELPFTYEAESPRAVDSRVGKVLVVDAHERVRGLMLKYLASFGLEAVAVATAAEAEAAINQAEAPPFSDVLVGGGMKVVPGLMQRLSAASRAHFRLIYLGGYPLHSQSAEAAKTKIADVLLTNPVTASRLYDVLMNSRETPVTVLQSAADLIGLRVLLVEDNLVNQKLAHALLTRMGLNVSVVGDGFEAIEALGQQDFDLVLMDMHLPHLGGEAATRRIRENPAWRKLPIIAMTANVMSGDRERCLSAGMNDYIAKPINVEILYATIARWVPPSCECESVSRLDLDRAIISMGGQDVYLTVLEKFVPNQGGAIFAIKDALAAPDKKKALRLAHTLKGIAAMIGALELSESVRQLEWAIQQDMQDQYIQRLAESASLMKQVIADVECYLKVNNSLPERGAIDDAEIASLEVKLREQLQVFDSQASDTMRQLRNLLKRSPVWPKFARLDRYISAYDYENALAEMQRIAQDKGGRTV